MNRNVAVVVTSIASPNEALRALAHGCANNGFQFIVIGDESSPRDFVLDGCQFLSLEAQRQLPFQFARACPARHYARKNIGYLVAMSQGAEVIIETDDDNLPYEGFWRIPERRKSMPVVTDGGWVNVYRYFCGENIWPRGLPLNHVLDQPASFASLKLSDVVCPIQQGLVDANPDTDAIYRLTSSRSCHFTRDREVALSKDCWSPFNSQNTVWLREAFPLMYLPAHCSFRMTDIWRSFVAQRIGWTNDWSVAFRGSTAWQQRNEHDLMRDFRDEIPGYLHNEAICRVLSRLPLCSGTENLSANLRAGYEALIQNDFISRDELDLIDAWIDDVKSARKPAEQ